MARRLKDHTKTEHPSKSQGKPRDRGPSFITPDRLRFGVLAGILLLAAILRLVALDTVPPAIHADEAPNAWNAYTLLKTGHDQCGVSWPVFYLRAYGDYRTATYAYSLIPFQFFGGMNVWTTRLPAAVSGILSVLLIYFIGARLFGAAVGLAAAGLLALNPLAHPGQPLGA
jgi:4-amino-4-deoxy-L-arabinose transferase-like glycosyltransferase